MTTGAARLVVMLLYLATVAPIGLGAQPGPAEPGAGAAQPGDLWEFEDEEESETWSALLQDQALDLSLFVAFATLALVSFFRKSAGSQIRDPGGRGGLSGVRQEPADFGRERLQPCDRETCRSSGTASRGICSPGSRSSRPSCGAASTAAASALTER